MSHYYQHAAAKIREGALVMQGLDNQRNLAAFLARQQRIKARQQQAQNTSNTIAATTITNADTSENDKEAHHV